MTLYWAVVFTLLGMALGSFFNVLADRLPAGKSIIRPASHCPACGVKLSVPDLVPVVSYLALKGRCRYCHAAIPRRMLMVELATGIMFLLLYLFYGLSPELGIALLYFSLLLLIFIIDLEQQLILNVIIYPSALAVLLINLIWPDTGITHGFLNGLAGGGAGLLLFLLIVIASRGGMGLGDVKMAGLMGLILGFPGIFVGIFLAVVSGGLVAGIILMLKRKSKRDPIPFGPFLSLGTMAAILWGQPIMDWYLGFFGF
ncbi:MAG: prepilin peptidase [Dehalococcoidaceae bacterium]|nr:prepilin peptidase [Dehalococcoidaceae bacterium]